MRDGLLVVDAHAHIELEERGIFGGRSTRMSTPSKLDQMDRYGIDASWVIAHAWAGWTLDQYRHEHDAIAAEVAVAPDRLFPLCWADPLLGPPMVDELVRAIAELGYRGIKLHPVYQRFAFDSRVVDPIVEVAREFGVPVTAHLDLRVPGCEPWRMVRLAERHPDVQFVMAHMGRDVRALQDLSFARAAADVSNVHLEGSSTATDAYGTFQGPAEVLGADRILFASDAGAFHHPAVNLLKIDLLDLSREDRAQILGLNAVRLLRLDVDAIGVAPDRRPGVFATALGESLYPVPAAALQPRAGG
jgi:predicted TIM-barrel fold metal-dependent hydrolase